MRVLAPLEEEAATGAIKPKSLCFQTGQAQQMTLKSAPYFRSCLILREEKNMTSTGDRRKVCPKLPRMKTDEAVPVPGRRSLVSLIVNNASKRTLCSPHALGPSDAHL